MEADPAGDTDADADVNDVVNNQADREAEVSWSYSRASVMSSALRGVACACLTFRDRLDMCFAGCVLPFFCHDIAAASRSPLGSFGCNQL